MLLNELREIFFPPTCAACGLVLDPAPNQEQARFPLLEDLEQQLRRQREERWSSCSCLPYEAAFVESLRELEKTPFLCKKCKEKLAFRATANLRLFLQVGCERRGRQGSEEGTETNGMRADEQEGGRICRGERGVRDQEAYAERFMPVLAATDYLYPSSRLVRLLKFHASPCGAEPLGLLARLSLFRYLVLLHAGILPLTAYDFPSPEVVAAVPLHESRLRERAYNQAEEILNVCNRGLGLPNYSEYLLRIKKTGRQSEQNNRAARLNNVRGAFCAVGEVWREKRVLLVDDVLTSGATLCAAADALYTAGARHVAGLVIASDRGRLSTAGKTRARFVRVYGRNGGTKKLQ